MNRTLSLVLGLAILAGCPAPDTDTDGTDTDDTDAPCTTEERPSVEVTVEDTAGSPVTGATVRYRVDGSDAVADCELSGDLWRCGSEIAGEITVLTEAPGFASDVQVVTVDEDECHVITEQVTVVLEPLGSDCEDMDWHAMDVWVWSVDRVELEDAAVSYRLEDGGEEAACAYDTLLSYWTCGRKQTGTFLVTASAAGHQTASQTVVVEDAECPMPVEVIFELERI